uniref:HNF-p1 domain-containing protein n=1 Tax=Panagrolaimus superbus TaxID=310955 RepID=A0A914YKQ9_9BILA
MNVSLSNLSGSSCILPSPIGTLSSGTIAESSIQPQSSIPTSPISTGTMTTGSLLQQLSNASFVNPAMAAAAAAAASVNHLLPLPSPLFTVEQLELIRRLRMTGISADAVLE